MNANVSLYGFSSLSSARGRIDRGIGLKFTSPDSSIYRLLVDAALIAARRSDDDAALQICRVLVGLGMNSAQLHSTIALLKLQTNPAGALRWVEENVLGEVRQSDLAIAVKAHALRALGRPGWQQAASSILSSSSNSLVRQLARDVLS
jgi:hypothetical protein